MMGVGIVLSIRIGNGQKVAKIFAIHGRELRKKAARSDCDEVSSDYEHRQYDHGAQQED